MEGLIGKKLGMTRTFDSNGEALPVTVIEAGPCHIVQIKTQEKEGYGCIQLGFDEVKAKYKKEVVAGKQVKKQVAPVKPLRGHFDKGKVPYLRTLKEFRMKDVANYSVGQILKADIFEKGERIDIIGTSKGKGFQGVVKRHKFAGGYDTHGSMSHRTQGSIGQSASPSEVMKGTRMGGRMGGVRHTAKNLEIVGVDPEKNIILIRGSVPGAVNSIVMLKRKSAKGARS